MPLYFARAVDTDEMVTFFGVFDAAPDPMEFVARGQKIVRNDLEDGFRTLELRYMHQEQQWHQWLYWAHLATGVVVVEAQELEGSSVELAAIARQIRSSLASRA